MAFASTTEWDVRTTGSDANAGAWDTASSGTDYSQSDTPQVAYTDLVIDATVNTKATSAGNPFTSAHVGNIINITSGTGFTVQRVQVVSVTSNVATCDKSLGTLSSTGGNGNLGGGLANLDTAAGVAQASSSQSGTYIHVKSGTYTRTTTCALQPVAGGSFLIVGYQTSHLDGGTRPLLTSATNSLRVVSVKDGSSNWLFENISFSHTAGTRGVLVGAGTNSTMMMFDNCVFDGGTYAAIADNSVANAGNIIASRCEVKNCTTGGIVAWFTLSAYDCYIHDNTGSALKKVSSQDDHFVASGCILTGNTKGIEAAYAPGGGGTSSNVLGLSIIRCTIASNTGDGINLATNNTSLRPVHIQNCIIYNNGGYGINAASKLFNSLYINKNDAFGSNTSGNTNNWTTGVNPVTLTADPFTNAAGGDYSLNHTVGGGASCRTAGYAGVFPGGNSTGFLDIGAVQTSGGAGSGILVHPGTGGGMRG